MSATTHPEIIGRYRIIRSLGEGAMGRVLLAHDPVLDREVALKHLKAALALSGEQRDALIQRMRQEARASARVSHPNIVTLHDMGDDPSVGLYLVFEYVPGPSLHDTLNRGSLGAANCAQLVREVGSALTMAHEAGVIHRDIKPENIMMSEVGSKIADFGIARLPDSTLTQAGLLLGTPAYSAPESIESGTFSSQSDQFSLAATIYEALVGHRAFPGDDAVAVASKIARNEPPAIADVCGLDRRVDTVLARALAKNPTARFDRCKDFGTELASAIEINPATNPKAVPPVRAGSSPESPPRRTRRLAAGAAAIGSMLTIAALQLTEGLKEPPPPVPFAAIEPVTPPAPPVEAPPVAWLELRPMQKRSANLPAAPAASTSARSPSLERANAQNLNATAAPSSFSPEPGPPPSQPMNMESAP